MEYKIIEYIAIKISPIGVIIIQMLYRLSRIDLRTITIQIY